MKQCFLCHWLARLLIFSKSFPHESIPMIKSWLFGGHFWLWFTISLSPKSGAWISAATTSSLGFNLSPNEISAAFKYWLSVKVYEKERKSHLCKFGTHYNGRTWRVLPWTLSYECFSRLFSKPKSVSLLECTWMTLLCEHKCILPENNSRQVLTCIESRQPATLDASVTSSFQPNPIAIAKKDYGFALPADKDKISNITPRR